jgi:tripartite-type tricarboxylate transporter receptor subunit TctC
MKKLFVILFFVSTTAIAQIEIIVPFAPGGPASNSAHLIAEMLSDAGRPAIVVNRPGGDAVIGANLAAKAAPNGRTLFLGTTSSLVANIVFSASGIEYNENSFVPIVPLNQLNLVLAVPAASPIKNYEQFKFYVQANPDQFNVGIFNANLGGVLQAWAEREKLPIPTIISYKGSSQVVTNLAGDNLPFAFDTYSAPLLPMVRAGRVRIIKTPDLNFSVWYGLFAPAGTPTKIIDDLNKTINQSIRNPKYQEKIRTMEMNIGGTSEDLKKLQQRDLTTFRKFKQ